MNSNIKIMMEGDKTRRKRLKVVSACGECRRKKTKCNGEKPCAGCIKAHVECKYVNAQKPGSATHNITTTATANKSAAKPAQKMTHSPTTKTVNDPTNKAIIKNASLSSATSTSSASTTTTASSALQDVNHSSNTPASSIESIEERLGTIENILRALLGSGKNKHLLQGFQAQAQQQQQQQQQQRSEPNAYMDPKINYYNHHLHQQQQQHSDISPNTSTSSSSLCGDMYSSPHSVHAPHIQNRALPRGEKRQRHEDEDQGMTENKRSSLRDDFGHGYHHYYNHQHHHHPYQKLQLAPIKIVNHSPGTPTSTSIRNLLNETTDDQDHPPPPPAPQQQKKPRWYPTSSSSASSSSSPTTTPSSAFYRMSSRNEIINSNSATTAAGTLS